RARRRCPGGGPASEGRSSVHSWHEQPLELAGGPPARAAGVPLERALLGDALVATGPERDVGIADEGHAVDGLEAVDEAGRGQVGPRGLQGLEQDLALVARQDDEDPLRGLVA